MNKIERFRTDLKTNLPLSLLNPPYSLSGSLSLSLCNIRSHSSLGLNTTFVLEIPIAKVE